MLVYVEAERWSTQRITLRVRQEATTISPYIEHQTGMKPWWEVSVLINAPFLLP